MHDEILRFFNGSGSESKLIGDKGARLVRSGARFGIFVPAAVPPDYFEDKLNSMAIRSGEINGRSGVFISCKVSALKEVFAGECARFLEDDCLQRIIEDPFSWWNELKALYGNVLADENHYFVFAEFLVFLMLHDECSKSGTEKRVMWKSCTATHDIEMSDGSQHEVKSTVRRVASVVTISSKFQMSVDPAHPFFLYFVRLEPERNDGVSIQDLIVRAGTLGCDVDGIDRLLTAQGLPPGSPKRRTRFAILEAKRFDAGTGPFPKLTPQSFRPECENLLAAVENFSYDINLSAVTCPKDDILDKLRGVARG